jgi:hypothetical protein
VDGLLLKRLIGSHETSDAAFTAIEKKVGHFPLVEIKEREAAELEEQQPAS